MSQKKKIGFNDVFEGAMYVLAAICAVYFFIQGDTQKTLQPFVIVGALLLIRILVKFSKIEFFPGLRFSIYIFIFITMFLANEFGFYGVIPYLDKIEHLLSGVILTFVGSAIFKRVNKGHSEDISPKIEVLLALFFGIAMAGVWEIYEFTIDRYLGFNSQNNNLVDTMTDIICGSVTSIGTAIYIYVVNKKKVTQR